MQAPRLVFHHVGIVTKSLEDSREFYEKLGYAASPVFDDSIQRVSIVLMNRGDGPMLELIRPSDEKSPAMGWLKRIQAGPYHTCYEVVELEPAIEFLRAEGALPVGRPAPAVAFGMRRVVFLLSDRAGLIELLEAPSSIPA